jgi:hypothetical protein
VLSLTFEEVVSEINHAIFEARPFSLIRLGDSENSILGYPDFFGAERVQRVLSRLLEDRPFSETEIVDIRGDLARAANGADIVGLYPSNHPKEYCALDPEVLGSAQIRVISGCYPSVHFYLAASGHLARMISTADQVTLITGRDVKARFDERFNTDARQLLVPSELIYRLNAEQTKHEHYPTIYQDVLGRIEVSAERHLFLVGAGILGKAYCQAAKDAGGIALDIGSVFDYWAGIPSREPRTPVTNVVRNGVALKVAASRGGLGLHDNPMKLQALRLAYTIGFKQIDLPQPGGPTTEVLEGELARLDQATDMLKTALKRLEAR